jgi:hypothetical protein
MSQNQDASAIEQVVRERREAERTVNRLYVEAERLSSSFAGELAASLLSSPELVVFESQLASVDFRYHTARGHNRVYKDEEGSARAIVLTAEIRSALLHLADLTEETNGRFAPPSCSSVGGPSQ